ncbi:hypothetical protein DK427_13780 [Methylobacterium radiodurans]|uniref:Uncharacterized protein n=2 Tax=Methylobacterium radiodurans TaxID=2202828 RepID=A0A2U8VTS4_9HYPH|nr:hypothetical protein DK427_13780 [Methylobacterium radiodurans]
MNQNWDHTYVTSSLGDAWGCYGRSAGGMRLVWHPGDRDVADCLARPDQMAGIRYGVTGVCHQMANRILYPANRILVSTARGYPWSRKLWRDYGLGPWPERTGCYSSEPTSSTAGGSSPPGGRRAASSRGSAVAQDDHLDPHLDWRRTAAEHGIPLTGPVIDRLAAADRELKDRQTRLIFRLDNHLIEPDTYLAELNAAVRDYLRTARSVLGGSAYTSIFGSDATDPGGLIDQDVFLASEAARSPATRPGGGAGGAMP